MPTLAAYGVDVGKGELTIARHEPPLRCTLRNERRSIRRWLGALPISVALGVESTGAYHQLIATLAHQAGHRVYVLDPRRIKAYRGALGQRAKTDRCDADLIALYLAREHQVLRPYVPASPAIAELSRLVRRRVRIVVCRQQLQSTMKDCPECRGEVRRLSEDFKRLLERVDRRSEELIRAEPERLARCDRLASIPGVGPLCSRALLVMLERIPYQDADAFVAATGLDPRPDDSGDRRGRRHLTKRGPAEIRRLLYTSAMAAARDSAPFKSIYQRYRARGLTATTAHIIIARKLVRIAFTLDRTAQNFDAARLLAT